MTGMIFTGIGSRETPTGVLGLMNKIGYQLGELGWTLRSGGADGADTAFEAGFVIASDRMEIYIPWPNFNGSKSDLHHTPAAFDIAARCHPNWNHCDDSARRLRACNVCQVLGQDLNTPSNLVIAWTPEGKVVGGAATALRIAALHHIAIINLGSDRWKGMSAEEVVSNAKRLAYLSGSKRSGKK